MRLCMVHALRDTLSSYARRLMTAEGGNLTVVAALALVGVALASGASLDYGNMVAARTQFAAAVGGAALQAGSSSITDVKKLTELARKSVAGNYSERDNGDITDFKLTYKDNQIDIDAAIAFRTSFMGIAGVNEIRIPVSAQVVRAGTNVEVALVLDVTGSMVGQPLQALQDAANDFVKTVVRDTQTPSNYQKVALVPYASGVNLGTYANAVRGTLTSGTCTTPGCATYKFKNANRYNMTFSATSCVSERTGSNAYTDTTATGSPVGINYTSPNNPCPDVALIPLTANKKTLTDAIDSLKAKGSTAGQIGIAWGWYTLSKNFGIWTGESVPAPYNTDKLKKIAVIMTDGAFNTAHCNGVVAQNSGNGSGTYDDKINCNATNGPSLTQAKSLCTEMKKKGIFIYTIGFNVGADADAVDVLTQCSSGTGYLYLAATTDELDAAFRDIGRKVSTLRLSK